MIGTVTTRWRHAGAILAVCVLALVTMPVPALAHGPSAPVATSDLARLGRIPVGLHARVLNGDLAMWMRVPSAMTVVVVDYRGAPYLRFSRSGVQVNENSSMYYLNQRPFPVTPPLSLNRRTPPRWRQVSSAHSYTWHDGRLHALATTIAAPGTAYVGRWSIPLRIDGHPASLSGGVWHRPDPSSAWFWPIVALFACAVAGWRIRSPELDAWLIPLLGVIALLGVAVSASAQELYGRPTVTVFHVIELAAIIAFAAWAARQLLTRRAGYLSLFLVSLLALWEGIELVPTLTHGYALTAVPGVMARVSTVLCLGAGTSMLLWAVRLVPRQRGAVSGP